MVALSIGFSVEKLRLSLVTASCVLLCSGSAFGQNIGQRPELTPPVGAPSLRPASGNMIRGAVLKYINDVIIVAQSDGLIQKISADEGDMVTKETLLIQLDVRLAQSELKVAETELNAAIEQAKDESEIQYNEAAYEVAKIAYETSQRLLSKGSEAEAEAQKKWLEFRRSELAIDVAKLKNKKDKSQVDIAEAKRDAANVQIQLRSIESPFDGVVVLRERDEFEWVKAGEPILRLVAQDRLRVVGSVKASDLSIPVHRLKGAKVRIQIQISAEAVEVVNGQIDFVSPVEDLGARYRVWCEIPNRKEGTQWLYRDGMNANIEILVN